MLFGTDRKIIILCLLIIFCCFGQIACAQQNAEQKEKERIVLVAKYEEAARQFREKNDFQSALQNQQKAVELNPDDDESFILLANDYIGLEQWENAVKELRKAQQLNPNNAWTHYFLAISLRRTSANKQEILEQLKDAVRLESRNTMFLVNLGSTYDELNNKKSAKESYQKAIEVDSNYTPAIYLLALLEMEDGNKTKAIELLNKVVSIKPKTETEKVYYDGANKKLKELEQSRK